MTAAVKSSIAVSTSLLLRLNPDIDPLRVSMAARRTKWGSLASAGRIEAPQPLTCKTPLKTLTKATFSGLSSCNFASKSPAASAAPSFEHQLTVPDSSTFKGINIFMTSISA